MTFDAVTVGFLGVGALWAYWAWDDYRRGERGSARRLLAVCLLFVAHGLLLAAPSFRFRGELAWLTIIGAVVLAVLPPVTKAVAKFRAGSHSGRDTFKR